MSRAQRIAVIGAGVIGLAIARELARSGSDVTVFDKSGIGAGTSTATFAWVNSNGKRPDSHHELNLAGMAAHKRLQERSPTTWFVASGTYEWSTSPERQLALTERAERLREKGYGAIALTRAAAQEGLPQVRDLPDVPIWSFPDEGYLHPRMLLDFLWFDARDHGAVLAAPEEVRAINERPGEIELVLRSGKRWRGDRVISAVGRWSASLMRDIGVELAMVDADVPGRIGCGFLGYTAPANLSELPNLIAPGLNVHPLDSGGLLLQATDLDDMADPVAPPGVDGHVGRTMVTRMQALLHGVDDVPLERISVGQRARPADGLPAVGYVSDRVYLAVMHSGMTLGLTIGELVRDEMLHDARAAVLADYGPGRLVGKKATDFGPIRSTHFPASQ